MTTTPGPASSPVDDALRVLVVPGTTPGRWLRTWAERRTTPAELVPVDARDGLDALRSGRADIGLVRLHERPDDVAGFRLYDEVSVAVVPRDHVVAAADEVTLGELDALGEDARLLVPADDVLGLVPVQGTARVATTAEAVELVAAGLGVLVVPQSLARLHDHRELTHRPVPDAPTSSVWLAWPAERTTEDVEHFVGIVRGRTANSSRGPAPDGSSGSSSGGSSGTARQAAGGPRARHATGADGRGRQSRGRPGARRGRRGRGV